MRKAVLAAGIAMLVVAGCSKPTELASEANAKYDRRDPVIAPPAPGVEVDVTPVEPIPGSPEAEALAPVELQPAPGEPTEGAPVETIDPAAPPTGAETLQPPAETTPPATEAAPPVTEPAVPAPTVPPPAETPPAPAPN